MIKLVFQVIAMLAIMFCDIHLATSGRPFEAMVITVSTIIVALRGRRVWLGRRSHFGGSLCG
jgi:hypothetical protein